MSPPRVRESHQQTKMATKTILSWESFLALGKEGEKCEWVDGEVVHMTPVNIRHERVLACLYIGLENYCVAHPGWFWIPSNAAFTMRSGNWRCPDASLTRMDRLPGGKIPDTRAEFPPGVAFEILSPSDQPGEIQRKRQDYHDSAVIQVWIDLDRRLVELICPDRPLQFFQENEVLVIGGVPDFALPLKNLFAI